MICFEVAINGQDQPATTAGIDSEGVLTVTVLRRDIRQRQSLRLDVSGLVHDSCHLEWVKRPLEVGDLVTVRIVDRPQADEPAKRQEMMPRAGLTIDESLAIAHQQREYWQERLRKLEVQKAAGAHTYVPDAEDDLRLIGE